MDGKQRERMKNTLKELDRKYSGYVGVDEAGRGNVAGSLVFCAAKLKPGMSVEDISFANDSKSMSKKKREELYQEVVKVVDTFVIFVSPEYIDENGISAAHTYALKQIRNHYKSDEIIYDGKAKYGVENIETLVKADAKVSIVAAASIVAKVSKDQEMEVQAKKYPEYDFGQNAGYGTKKHIEAIKRYGYTPIHRKSYKIKALEGVEIPLYKRGGRV